MNPAPPAHRVANLDLLRAVAIMLVVISNSVTQGVLDLGAWGNHIAESGWIGVDLFFVLSGWLVGGLYWKEQKTFGNVQIVRFWGRRWLRTIPPYLVVLAGVSGVYLALGGASEDMSWRYLVFLQNYLSEIPYWAVSWSLCVEEHMYLALPLVLWVALRHRRGVPLVLGAIAGLSLVARVLTVPDGAPTYGIQYTATHMRLEGIVLGVLAAYVYHLHEDLWPRLRRVGELAVVPALVFLAFVPWLSPDGVNRWAYTGIDLSFAALLIAVADRANLPTASSQGVKWVALTSYSVYMTHTSVLRLYREIAMAWWPDLPMISDVLLVGLLIGIVGAVFYQAVERPSMLVRQRWVPRRGRQPSPALVAVQSP